MELKFEQYVDLCRWRKLLIEPYGIEMTLALADNATSDDLLIEPYGIEIINDAPDLVVNAPLLIEPYGIEIK